jgi:hypothetical protein
MVIEMHGIQSHPYGVTMNYDTQTKMDRRRRVNASY